jgi:phosphoglucosamine mutase
MLTFGTDGVRGVAFDELSEEYVFNLGRVAAQVLGINTVVIGRDTRESGQRLLTALSSGFVAGGASVQSLGVVPTPLVAFVAAQKQCAGAVVTASHNPYSDNGVKIFAVGGVKLSDEQQDSISNSMALEPMGALLAEIPQLEQPTDSYLEHLASLFTPKALSGVRVVLDCANGAMSDVAPYAFARLGAEVIAIHCEPDGKNINAECGAAHTDSLSEAVRLHQADMGLAFDGDGDRVIACDHAGNVVDGDHLLALAATDLRDRKKLRNNTVAVTVMTNAGFHRAMKEQKISVVTTAVGDRNILVALDKHDLVLGGEQSGHIIYRNHATTGDGALAGLMLLDLVRRKGVPLQQLAHDAMTSLPQVLINVKVERMEKDLTKLFAKEIAGAEKQLQGVGRVLLRASGTEPLVRVMVEAQYEETAGKVAQALADSVILRLGQHR